MMEEASRSARVPGPVVAIAAFLLLLLPVVPAAEAHNTVPLPVWGRSEVKTSAPATSFGSVIATIPVDGSPHGIAFDAANGMFYVASSVSDNVSVVSGTTFGIQANLTVGEFPDGVAVDGSNGDVYVADGFEHNVSYLDAATNSVLGKISAGNQPAALAFDPSNGEIFVASNLGDNVSIINGATNQFVKNVTAGDQQTGIAYDGANGDVYVTDSLMDQVTVIAAATGAVLKTLRVGPSPSGVAVDPDNGNIYVVDFQANNLTVINGTSNTVVGDVETGIGPYNVAVDPANGYLYVSQWGSTNVGGNVSVIDGRTGQMVGLIGVGSWPGAMALDPASGDLFVLNELSRDISVISTSSPTGPASWTPLSPTSSPGARAGAALVYDVNDAYSVLFGGFGCYSGSTCAGSLLQDTWKFEGGTWTNITPSTITASNTPPARAGASMTYDPAEGYVLLFGGTGSRLYDDTWTFWGGVWTNVTATTITATNTPPGRSSASLTFDAADGYPVLFGGQTRSAVDPYLQDTWKFVGGTWVNITAATITGSNTPVPRTSSAMTYDAADGYVVLFGGVGCSSTYSCVYALQDTWKFSGGAWTNISAPTFTSSNTPQTRYGASMTFDAADGYVVLFGGKCAFSWCGPIGKYAQFQDTWKFLGGTWTNVTASTITSSNTPSSRLSAAMTYDATDGFVLLFGGVGCATGWTCTVSTSLQDTWKYGAGASGPVISSFTATPSSIQVGGTSYLNVSASGGIGTLSYAYTGLPAGCSTGDTASLVCHPTASGTFSPRVYVNDTASNSATSTTTLVVHPATSGPTIAAFGASPSPVQVGWTTFLNVSASGGTAPLGYAFSGLPTGCSTADVPSLSCQPTSSGSFEVRVYVNDSVSRTATSTTTLSVNPAGSTPVISSFSATPSTLTVGATTTFTVSATGGAGSLSYAYAGLPPGCATTNAASFPCTPSATGTFTVRVYVNDSGSHSATAVASLTVDPASLSPLASVSISPPSATVAEGGSVSFTASATCNGGACPAGISYLWALPGLTAHPSGSLSPLSGATTTYTAGTSTGTVILELIGTLDGASKTANATITITLPSSSPPTFLGLPQTQGYLLLGGLVAVIVLALLAVMILARRRRKRTGVPSPGSGESPTPPYELGFDPGLVPPGPPELPPQYGAP